MWTDIIIGEDNSDLEGLFNSYPPDLMSSRLGDTSKESLDPEHLVTVTIRKKVVLVIPDPKGGRGSEIEGSVSKLSLT